MTTVDPLTPAERNSLKWQQLAERYDVLLNNPTFTEGEKDRLFMLKFQLLRSIE